VIKACDSIELCYDFVLSNDLFEYSDRMRYSVAQIDCVWQSFRGETEFQPRTKMKMEERP
jgi:hypothetical protein